MMQFYAYWQLQDAYDALLYVNELKRCVSTEKGLTSCLRENMNSVKQCSILQYMMIEEYVSLRR